MGKKRRQRKAELSFTPAEVVRWQRDLFNQDETLLAIHTLLMNPIGEVLIVVFNRDGDDGYIQGLLAKDLVNGYAPMASMLQFKGYGRVSVFPWIPKDLVGRFTDFAVKTFGRFMADHNPCNSGCEDPSPSTELVN